jgi:hypothetical protein
VLLTQDPRPPAVGSARGATVPVRSSRGLAGGALAGAVAAGPALGSSLLSACLTCVGAGTAATAGVAAGAGATLGGVVVGGVVLAAVILLQMLRTRRACPARARGRYLGMRMAVITATAVTSFAALQWLTVADANPPPQQPQPSQIQRLP